MSKESSGGRSGWVKVLLVVVPLWLLLSGAGAVWWLLQRDANAQAEEIQRFAREVSAAAMADDLRKFVEIIGERHSGDEKSARQLSRAAAMIDGTLGPSNIGYNVSRMPGPAGAPLLYVTLAGTRSELPALWVVCAYDSRRGKRGAEANATGVAAVLAAAQALAASPIERSVSFVFLPHGNDADGPVQPVVETLKRLASEAKWVFCVEAMGSPEPLWVGSRDPELVPVESLAGLGKAQVEDSTGPEGDLASLLHDAGLPALRVATRPRIAVDAADEVLPDAHSVAVATGRLVEFIRRCGVQR